MKLIRWLASRLNGQARLAQQRDDAYAAFQKAIRAGDTRAQNITWAILNQATNAELTALIHGHRRPSGWRGR